jgi:hypothetical protein
MFSLLLFPLLLASMLLPMNLIILLHTVFVPITVLILVIDADSIVGDVVAIADIATNFIFQ